MRSTPTAAATPTPIPTESARRPPAPFLDSYPGAARRTSDYHFLRRTLEFGCPSPDGARLRLPYGLRASRRHDDERGRAPCAGDTGRPNHDPPPGGVPGFVRRAAASLDGIHWPEIRR